MAKERRIPGKIVPKTSDPGITVGLFITALLNETGLTC
jgi:hypothetical protein